MRMTKSVTLIPMILPLALACAGYSHRGAAKETADAYNPHIDASDFQGPVDNPYFPLIPGTVFKYVEKTRKGTSENIVEVTHDTKVILGVTCVVVSDKVTKDGELEEDTFDWYAQ